MWSVCSDSYLSFRALFSCFSKSGMNCGKAEMAWACSAAHTSPRQSRELDTTCEKANHHQQRWRLASERTQIPISKDWDLLLNGRQITINKLKACFWTSNQPQSRMHWNVEECRPEDYQGYPWSVCDQNWWTDGNKFSPPTNSGQPLNTTKWADVRARKNGTGSSLPLFLRIKQWLSIHPLAKKWRHQSGRESECSGKCAQVYFTWTFDSSSEIISIVIDSTYERTNIPWNDPT